jgi:hypothetical protein
MLESWRSRIPAGGVQLPAVSKPSGWSPLAAMSNIQSYCREYYLRSVETLETADERSTLDVSKLELANKPLSFLGEDATRPSLLADMRDSTPPRVVLNSSWTAEPDVGDREQSTSKRPQFHLTIAFFCLLEFGNSAHIPSDGMAPASQADFVQPYRVDQESNQASRSQAQQARLPQVQCYLTLGQLTLLHCTVRSTIHHGKFLVSNRGPEKTAPRNRERSWKNAT